jgi:hypothetical protein
MNGCVAPRKSVRAIRDLEKAITRWLDYHTEIHRCFGRVDKAFWGRLTKNEIVHSQTEDHSGSDLAPATTHTIQRGATFDCKWPIEYLPLLHRASAHPIRVMTA